MSGLKAASSGYESVVESSASSSVFKNDSNVGDQVSKPSINCEIIKAVQEAEQCDGTEFHRTSTGCAAHQCGSLKPKPNPENITDMSLTEFLTRSQVVFADAKLDTKKLNLKKKFVFCNRCKHYPHPWEYMLNFLTLVNQNQNTSQGFESLLKTYNIVSPAFEKLLKRLPKMDKTIYSHARNDFYKTLETLLPGVDEKSQALLTDFLDGTNAEDTFKAPLS